MGPYHYLVAVWKIFREESKHFFFEKKKQKTFEN